MSNLSEKNNQKEKCPELVDLRAQGLARGPDDGVAGGEALEALGGLGPLGLLEALAEPPLGPRGSIIFIPVRKKKESQQASKVDFRHLAQTARSQLYQNEI